MSAQPGNNNGYGSGQSGGPQPSYGFQAPRQDMSYLCAGGWLRKFSMSIWIACSADCFMSFPVMSPMLPTQIADVRTRSSLASRSAAGLVAIASCTRSVQPEVSAYFHNLLFLLWRADPSFSSSSGAIRGTVTRTYSCPFPRQTLVAFPGLLVSRPFSLGQIMIQVSWLPVCTYVMLRRRDGRPARLKGGKFEGRRCFSSL